MALRKNKKFIDPRYFMDEKTEIVKEGFTTSGPDPSKALSQDQIAAIIKMKGMDWWKKAGPHINGENIFDYLDPAYASEIMSIKEELPQADSFSGHLSLSNSIRDAIIGHLENEKLFEMGAIPQSVIRVIENSSLRIADAAEGME